MISFEYISDVSLYYSDLPEITSPVFMEQLIFEESEKSTFKMLT